MQFITTRSSEHKYDLFEVLNNDFAPDGGHFVPVNMPVYPLYSLQGKSFSGIVAEVLNQFFDTQFTGWDLDFTVGRGIMRLVSMNHKIVVAELWRNLERDSAYIVTQLYKKVTNSENKPSLWFEILVKIALRFGVYAQMRDKSLLSPGQIYDISLMNNDQSDVMSAIYAKKMGLPIGTIIMTCEDNSPVWDIIHRGGCNAIADNDILGLQIEWLIYTLLGSSDAKVYRNMMQSHQMYIVPEESYQLFSEGLFCSVPGLNRASDIINSVYRTNAYFVDIRTALCYGALQDYRSRVGAGTVTLLEVKHTPADSASQISRAAGISEEFITSTINLS